MTAVGNEADLRPQHHMRAYVFPEPGDVLSSVAARQFPDDPDAHQRLLSWNMHLVLRRSLTAETTQSKDPQLLPTDVVYLEPPLPS
jgi:hypothetical protein